MTLVELGSTILAFLPAYSFALNIMGFAAFTAALEPDLATDTFQQTHMEPGTDICKSAKNCPVSQSYLSALNQAVAVQEVVVPTNILQKRKKGEPGTLLPPVQK